jgi:parvulin-like peptidyl-prolyl isomerase
MKRYFLLLTFALFGGLVFAQTDLQPVAIVRLSKSQPVSVKEFKDYVTWINRSRASAAAQYGQPAPPPLSAEERRGILDTMTNQLLACQAAEQDNVTLTDRELNEAADKELKPIVASLVEILTARLKRTPSEADIDNEFYAKTGMTRAGYKEYIRRSLLTEKYLQFKKQALLQSVKAPTDSEIQSLYNQLKTRTTLEGGLLRPDAVRIKMIWIPVTNPANKAAALEKANQLVRQIGGDAEKFDEAVDNSQRANSGYEAGDGPYLYKVDQIRAVVGIDFFDTAFRLKQGEVSKLLERSDGYYIIKVIETLRQKTFIMEDVYRTVEGKPMTVKEYISAVESQKRYRDAYEKASLELIEDLKKRGTVQIMDSAYNSITW